MIFIAFLHCALDMDIASRCLPLELWDIILSFLGINTKITSTCWKLTEVNAWSGSDYRATCRLLPFFRLFFAKLGYIYENEPFDAWYEDVIRFHNRRHLFVLSVLGANWNSPTNPYLLNNDQCTQGGIVKHCIEVHNAVTSGKKLHQCPIKDIDIFCRITPNQYHLQVESYMKSAIETTKNTALHLIPWLQQTNDVAVTMHSLEQIYTYTSIDNFHATYRGCIEFKRCGRIFGTVFLDATVTNKKPVPLLSYRNGKVPLRVIPSLHDASFCFTSYTDYACYLATLARQHNPAAYAVTSASLRSRVLTTTLPVNEYIMQIKDSQNPFARAANNCMLNQYNHAKKTKYDISPQLIAHIELLVQLEELGKACIQVRNQFAANNKLLSLLGKRLYMHNKLEQQTEIFWTVATFVKKLLHSFRIIVDKDFNWGSNIAGRSRTALLYSIIDNNVEYRALYPMKKIHRYFPRSLRMYRICIIDLEYSQRKTVQQIDSFFNGFYMRYKVCHTCLKPINWAGAIQCTCHINDACSCYLNRQQIKQILYDMRQIC